MKHYYPWRYGISLLLLMATTSLMAQQKGKVIHSDKNEFGVYKQITFDAQQEAIPLSESKQMLKTYLELSTDDELKAKSSKTDEIGIKHDRYDQFYKNIKVEFGSYIVHSKNGLIHSVNGEFKKINELNTSPSISAENALQAAMNEIGGTKYMWENTEDAKLFNYEKPTGELVVLKGKLAYKFDVYSAQPVVRAYVYVDAQSGKVLFKNPIIKHAVSTGTAATRYSGTKTINTDSNAGSFRLRDYSRGNGVETYDMNTSTNYASAIDFTDNDNNWSSAEFDNTAKDNAALDAHWGAQMTYDYFNTAHGRNSFDGAGAIIKSYVHFDVSYENAYWNGSVMTYGDGATRFDALTSLDVAAHEIGHAVCETTANLVYSNESGAMNEGLSDIWGAAVEFYAAPTKSTWLIGEDIDQVQPSLRSMIDPKAEGQPDTYKGTNWYTGTLDNGGVHTNSGVLNHWFYILSIGKTGTNDIGTSYSVAGIGIDKAAKIAYRMESVYMTSTSVYADARTYAIQAAADLYGAGSNEEIQTTNAWNAVGIGGKFGELNYCTSNGQILTDEYISGVQLGTINNVTGASAGGYGDYTSISTDLALGSLNTIIITPTWPGTVYNEGYAVWIDYNIDGDFADAGELVYSKAPSNTTPVSGAFTVPTGATTGTTRMRVSLKYNAIPTVCESFQYGEVEDYAVNITGGGPDTSPPSTPTGLAASNITTYSVNLSWNASTDNVGVTGYDVLQNGLFLASSATTSYSVTGLTSGTTYSYTVKAKDAAGNLSAASTALNVTTLTPDTTPPSTPTGLTITNITTSSATLSWTISTDNVGVTGYDVYNGAVLAGSTTSPTFAFTGLSASTFYTVSVKAKDAAGNISTAGTTSFTTSSASVSYCASNGINSSYEWIDLVELGTMSNVTSSNGGYGDFTSLTATVTAGSTNSIYLSTGFSSTSYTEYWKVWIDLNHDGDFIDAGEELVSGSSSSSNRLVATLIIPASATLGTTRMRVSMKYNAAPTSCETFAYGEVEDYTVNITNVFAGFNNGLISTIEANALGNELPIDYYNPYPNPVSNMLRIALNNEESFGQTLRLISPNGAVMQTIEVNSKLVQIDMTDLPNGIYIISLQTERETINKKIIKQ